VQLSTIFSLQASFEVGVSRSYQLRSTCFSQNFGLLLSPMIAGARRYDYVSNIGQTLISALDNLSDAGPREGGLQLD
jgi:hypothetical protein